MNSSTETTKTTTSNTTAVLVEMKPRRATWQTALPTFHLPKAVGVPVVIQCLNIRLVPDCLAATTTNLNSLCKNKMCWWEFCQNQEHNSGRHSKILETTYENCWSPTSLLRAPFWNLSGLHRGEWLLAQALLSSFPWTIHALGTA